LSSGLPTRAQVGTLARGGPRLNGHRMQQRNEDRVTYSEVYGTNRHPKMILRCVHMTGDFECQKPAAIDALVFPQLCFEKSQDLPHGPVGRNAWKAAWMEAGRSERFSSNSGPGRAGTQTRNGRRRLSDIRRARRMEDSEKAYKASVAWLGGASSN